MGDDASHETSILETAGIAVYLAPTPDPSDWREQAKKADAILTRHATIDAETIDDLESCKIIARYGTGHDNIDIGAAKRRCIVVTAVFDYATDEVATHTIALILALNRALPGIRDGISRGGWTPKPLPRITRLAGKTLGLVGCGRIGAAVTERARSFGMEVWVFDPYADQLPDQVKRAESLDDLLRASYVLSLHAPLTPETQGMIGDRELDKLPSGAIVINVARGGLLDLDAALSRLKDGALGGLGLDVTPIEPLPRQHIARNHPQVIVTPHIGYYSDGSVLEAKEKSAGEIVRVLAGEEPENPVFRL